MPRRMIGSAKIPIASGDPSFLLIRIATGGRLRDRRPSCEAGCFTDIAAMIPGCAHRFRGPAHLSVSAVQLHQTEEFSGQGFDRLQAEDKLPSRSTRSHLRCRINWRTSLYSPSSALYSFGRRSDPQPPSYARRATSRHWKSGELLLQARTNFEIMARNSSAHIIGRIGLILHTQHPAMLPQTEMNRRSWSGAIVAPLHDPEDQIGIIWLGCW
jgi:hypothetical protein